MKPLKILCLLFSICFVQSLHAFDGTNQPGAYTDFTILTAQGQTELFLSVQDSQSGISSQILLKKGSALTDNSDYDFISTADHGEQIISLSDAQVTGVGTWYVRVVTASDAAESHNFTLRYLRYLPKPLKLGEQVNYDVIEESPIDSSMQISHSRIYRLTTPENWNGARIVVNTLSLDDSIPLDTESDRTQYYRWGGLGTSNSTSATNFVHYETIYVEESQVAPNSTYYITIRAFKDFKLRVYAESLTDRVINWDDGTSAAGTNVVSAPDIYGGDYQFKVTTRSNAVNAWRSILNVTSGEANLHIQKDNPPYASKGTYYTEKTGSDGLVLNDTEYGDNETWYIKVSAQPGAQWSLVTGDIFANDLGTLAGHTSTASSASNITVGPEGIAYFKTEVPVDTKAWRLSTADLTNNIYIEKGAAPVVRGNSKWFEKKEEASGQMLLVPQYLDSGLYYVGVSAAPGSVISLDSRKQEIRTPSLSSGYSGSDEFKFDLTGSDDNGYGYVTYKVDVPVDQIAWQVNMEPAIGVADVYIRQGEVANRYYNSGLSEAPNTVVDSVVQVPPTLTDGSWYITVRGTGSFSYNLSSDNPTITPIDFINETPLINDLINQSGWRYYKVSNITDQLSHLGWQLELAEQESGTEIALRRNAVPGRWSFRANGSESSNPSSGYHYDKSTLEGFLQRQSQPADIWYVGIYTPNQALGAFELTTTSIPSPGLTFNGGTETVSSQTNKTWKYFKVVVPEDTQAGWDLRLTNVTAGDPQLTICRDQLPGNCTDASIFSGSTTWQSGTQTPVGNGWQGSTNADGSRTRDHLVAGMNAPLEAGTYYVGVYGNQGAMSYTLESKGIGEGNNKEGSPWAIQIETLAFNSTKTASINTPGEARFYKVLIPENTTSLDLDLNLTLGDAYISASFGGLNNNQYSSNSASIESATGRLIRYSGDDHYYYFASSGYLDYETSPSGDRNYIRPGAYYFTVISEGQNAVNTNTLGTGSVSYALSTGMASIKDKTSTPLGVSDPVTWTNESLIKDELQLYRFSLPEGIQAMELRLTNTSGAPITHLEHQDSEITTVPYASQSCIHEHLADGGYSPDRTLCSVDDVLSWSEPAAGDYVLLVKSHNGASSYDIEVTAIGETDLAFNNGSESVVDQSENTWNYFKVVVPEDTQAGWDLRLTNVTAGDPQLTICRDQLPGNCSDASVFSGSTTWQSGTQTSVGSGWQGSTNADGSRTRDHLVAGMNAPLEAGTYYVGVYGNQGAMSYTLESKGIGEGNNKEGSPWAIQIETLAFNSTKTASINTPGEARFYKVLIPENTTSLDLDLNLTLGDAYISASFGRLNNNQYSSDSASIESATGRLIRYSGDDHYYYFASSGYLDYETSPSGDRNYIRPGAYYFTVISEGQNAVNTNTLGTGSVSYALSTGMASIKDKTSTPLGVSDPVTWTNESLIKDELQLYRFSLPQGIQAMELRLTNASGPAMAFLIYQDNSDLSKLPYTRSQCDHKNLAEGGYHTNGKILCSVNNVLNWTEPSAGDYILLVKSSDNPSVYDIEVTAIGETDLAFNNGSESVVDQSENTWKYFKVVVPEDTQAGWDLRLTNVTAGDPQLTICRDQLPGNCADVSVFSSSTTWQSGIQTTIGNGWQGSTNADGSRTRDHLVAGMNVPLEAGTYYVGVYGNQGDMSYTLESKGIGEGDNKEGSPWAIQITTINYWESVSDTIANPGDVHYYKVTGFNVDNVKGWDLHLDLTQGEAYLDISFGHLPNNQYNPDNTIENAAGRIQRKPGDEHYYMFPSQGYLNFEDSSEGSGNRDWIRPGDYFVAVTSEGQNPANTGTLGTGPVSYSLNSKEVGVKKAVELLDQPLVWSGESLDHGDLQLYSFDTSYGVPIMNVRLKNITGTPCMSMSVLSQEDLSSYKLNQFPRGCLQNTYDMLEGGYSGPYKTVGIEQLLNWVKPSDSTYYILVQAPKGDVSYDVEVTWEQPQTLSFANGQVSGTLIDTQRRFYTVEVPELYDGQEIEGWRLGLEEVNGNAKLYLKKDRLPFTISPQDFDLNTDVRETIISEGLLSPGTWYVSVEATGLTDFTLTSHPVLPERKWSMPANGEPFSQQGISAPYFGDTGRDNTGNKILNLQTGDIGTDLQKGTYHFYKISVPKDNGGLLRTYLEAISGDPDIYISEFAPPTLNHKHTAQNYGYQRSNTGSGTLYGNWVDLDGKDGAALTPGDWWVAIYANQSNVRYQLRLAAGNVNDNAGALQDAAGLVQEMAQDGGSYSGQLLAKGDMRYYRVKLPEADINQANSTPTEWKLNITKNSGDIVTFVRDTIPPGNGTYIGENYLKDWGDDNSYLNPDPYVSLNGGGTFTLNIPPLKPGGEYFLGVYARTDASFDIGSSISNEKLKLDGALAFANGSLSTSIPAGESRLYRIAVPAGASSWHHTSTHASGVKLYLGQSTVPPKDYYAHWLSNTSSDSAYDKSFFDSSSGNNYPWQPAHDYYLVIDNTEGTSQSVEFTMAGELLINDDFDEDGINDEWEVNNGGFIGYFSSNSDRDGDGVRDIDEQTLGTDPNKTDSDGDGMSDGFERDLGLNPLDNSDTTGDSDGDGLTDLEEFTAGTDPKKVDSDDDGLSDYAEVKTHLTDPNDTDSDDDGLTDSEEITLTTNPLNKDTDADGMDDLWEKTNGTDPLVDDALADPDGDKLLNKDEFLNGTNPLLADTDGDGLTDEEEVVLTLTNPLKSDTDEDGLPDAWEVAYSLDATTASATDDTDSDGFNNLVEFRHSTDPTDENSQPEYLGAYHQSFEDGQVIPTGFKSSGVAEWLVVDQDASDGVQSIQTSSVNLSEMHKLDWRKLTQAGTLTFDIKIDASYYYEYAHFYVDGGNRTTIYAGTNNGDWQTITVAIEKGDHDFTWEYSANYASKGDENVPGRAYIDNIRFIPTDTDEDGMPDYWEDMHGFDSSEPADAELDADSDGLTNAQEYLVKTNPNEMDTDGNGVNDPDEDFDGDGVTNLKEFDTSLAESLDIDGNSEVNSFDFLMIRRHIGSVSAIETNIALPTEVGGLGVNGAMTRDELKTKIDQLLANYSLDIDGDLDTDLFDLLMIQRYIGGVSNLATNIKLAEGVGGSDANGARTNDELRAAVAQVVGF